MERASEVQTGTTIVACVCNGGVVLAADGKVSVGNYVSNRASNKLAPLSENTYILRSGSAPDTQAIADYVRYYIENLKADLGYEPSVRTVANLVRTMNYNNKHLVGAIIVAGWDHQNGGQVYSCPIGGTIVQEPWTTDGSGSTYIWGYLDAAHHSDMSQSDAEGMITEAVALAMARDGSSGGVIRVVSINQGGVQKRYLQGEDIPVFQDDLPVALHTQGVVVSG